MGSFRSVERRLASFRSDAMGSARKGKPSVNGFVSQGRPALIGERGDRRRSALTSPSEAGIQLSSAVRRVPCRYASSRKGMSAFLMPFPADG